MSDGERFYAILNGVVDVFLLAVFVAAVWTGITRDANALVFWVPFLGIAGFFRIRQARERWKL